MWRGKDLSEALRCLAEISYIKLVFEAKRGKTGQLWVGGGSKNGHLLLRLLHHTACKPHFVQQGTHNFKEIRKNQG